MLLVNYDWKNAMLIVSGLVLNLCVAGALLRPLEPPRRKGKPRAKNMLDRLMEQARKGVGRTRQDSECSTCAYQVKDRVQEVKLAREQALREEDSESEFSFPNSVINSVRRLDSRNPSRANSIVINRMDSFNLGRPSLAGTPVTENPIPAIILPSLDDLCKENPKVAIENPSDVSPSGVDTTDVDDADEKVGILTKEEEDSDASKPRKPIYRPMFKSGCAIPAMERLKLNGAIEMNGSVPNGMALCPEQKNGVAQNLLQPGDFTYRIQSQSTGIIPIAKPRRRKCPPGIHREDYSRPMYRKDIFYSGSILQIPEFQSQPNVQVYIKSITSIPKYLPYEEETGIGRCSCIPKSVRDTLKQMMDLSLLKDPLFLVPCLGNLFGAVGLFIPYIYITQKALSLGISDTDAAFLLSVIGMYCMK